MNCKLDDIGILQILQDATNEKLLWGVVPRTMHLCKEVDMANLEAVTTSGAVLGQVLVKLRTSTGLKQHELAEAVGVSASTWSRIEKGDSGLSIDQLRAAAQALGVSAALILQMVEEAEKEVKSRGIEVKSTWSVGPVSGVAAGMAAGAAVGGVVLPVIGTALGSLIGGVVATVFSKKDGEK